jgi:hypothetical protein
MPERIEPKNGALLGRSAVGPQAEDRPVLPVHGEPDIDLKILDGVQQVRLLEYMHESHS